MTTVEIDGGKQSGSGTIVRYAVALAALMGKRLHLFNARAAREKPGLRPQHLASVLACAEMCGGKTEGASIGSSEFTFVPGATIKGGDYKWEIGTAGSATMLALSILPLACFADRPVTAHITGGIFQDFAPSPHHMEYVLAKLLRRMGANIALQVLRAGYVPKGAGVIKLSVQPVARFIEPIQIAEQGSVSNVSGIAFSSHLRERQVSERMAQSCEKRLAGAGLSANIERVYDTCALNPGAALAVWAEGSTGCIIGADRPGAFRRSSEAIGNFVAETLLSNLAAGATVDAHAADQLVLFAALASGISRYRVPSDTEHLKSNLWLAEQFGAKARYDRKMVLIEGVGYCRR
ncbi:MAG: RNA 3'-phosphate cyclase [Deltaproteobacteria bacterium]|nr:RNA 3'-phosphate cyclase [Deltaproteobacteria bacterium]